LGQLWGQISRLLLAKVGKFKISPGIVRYLFRLLDA
jgi:hypothetical protein